MSCLRVYRCSENELACLPTRASTVLYLSLVCGGAGGEAEAGGAHPQREENPAGHQLPFPSQFRVPF